MSKCWYCNEELTTANYCDEHIGICTKCYGSMFKASNEFVKGLKIKIADLEAKLAESERRLINCVDFDTWQKAAKENNQLRQQLVEKEKEIEQLKEQRHIYLNRSVEECNKITDLEFELQHKDQDKISFAVEQLEKVKDEIDNTHYFNTESECNVVDSYGIWSFADNQIKQLKEGKQYGKDKS